MKTVRNGTEELFPCSCNVTWETPDAPYFSNTCGDHARQAYLLLRRYIESQNETN